jgi:two-component system, cell cycle sensor histidine kinase DivJ
VLHPGTIIKAAVAALDNLVHPDARRDRRARGMHRRFIAVRIASVAIACALMPIYALLRGPLSTLETVVLVTVALMLMPALLVSRTGRLDLGHALSALLMSGAIVVTAQYSGGLLSPSIALFVVVLLDAAVSGCRRSLRGAVLVTVIGLATLLLLPSGDLAEPVAVSLVALALICHALALAFVLVGRGERQAASQMRSQARATAALDTVADAVLWREPDGEISFANAAAHGQLGFDRRAFNESALLERVNVGDRPAFLKALADARSEAAMGHALLRIAVDSSEGRTVRLFEMSVRQVDGSSAHPVMPDSDAVSSSTPREEALVIALRDVTARHAADELRESARLEAERIASSKSQFLATMSHELRTPLNAIIGFSELLVQPGLVPPGDPRRDEYARIINGSGQHLLEVVNAILDMSKIESGMMTVEQERVEVPAVLRSSRELLAVRAADKKVELTESVAPDLPDIIADRRALKQVMLNLMSNAVKFTPEGGTVTVTAVRDRDHVEIVVADTGCGISEGDLVQLGAPFFQARQSYDRQHEGTGLGLSVVRGLLGLLGGALLIESAPDSGTRVVVRLPVGGRSLSPDTAPVPIATRIRARRPALSGLDPAQPAASATWRMTA